MGYGEVGRGGRGGQRPQTNTDTHSQATTTTAPLYWCVCVCVFVRLGCVYVGMFVSFQLVRVFVAFIISIFFAFLSPLVSLWPSCPTISFALARSSDSSYSDVCPPLYSTTISPPPPLPHSTTITITSIRLPTLTS